MAVQREWKDDPKGEVKLLAYKPKAKEMVEQFAIRWTAPTGGWMGLSEITAHNGRLCSSSATI